jgi:hypothetical protein
MILTFPHKRILLLLLLMYDGWQPCRCRCHGGGGSCPQGDVGSIDVLPNAASSARGCRAVVWRVGSRVLKKMVAWLF